MYFFHFSVHGHSVKQKGIGFKIEIPKIIHLSRLKKGNYRISTAFRCTQKNGVNVEVVRQQNNSKGFQSNVDKNFTGCEGSKI